MNETPAHPHAAAVGGQLAGSRTHSASDKKEATQRRRASLEREIIVAVMVLYLAIVGVMLAVHYLQPEGQAAVSPSSHSK